MKKLSTLIAVIALIASVLVSCSHNTDSQEKTVLAKLDGSVHPPKVKGDGEEIPGNKLLPEQKNGYGIGEIATDFKLKNVDGNLFSLSDIKDAKGYIVVFTCNGCPYAKMYEDRLIALHKEYAPKGYSVVAINTNVNVSEKESFEAMQKRAEEKQFPYVYLADEGQKIFPQYGALRTPHVFLLDNERKVQYIGAIDDNAKSPEHVKVKYVENAIQALENGEKPNPDFTKAIGCTVKFI